MPCPILCGSLPWRTAESRKPKPSTTIPRANLSLIKISEPSTRIWTKLDHDDSLLRNALEERKSVFVADSPEAAETLVALGLLRVRKVNLKKQSDLSVKAWRLIAKVVGCRISWLCSWEGHSALCYTARGSKGTSEV